MGINRQETGIVGAGTPWLALAALVLAVGCDEPTGRGMTEPHSSEARPRAGVVYAPCGTPLAEVDGVWAYSNGANTTTGDSCTGNQHNAVGAYEYQCVEFAQRYMYERFSIPQPWPVSAAKQMCSAHPGGVTPHAAPGYAPVRGDLAVWGEGTWGHVAVVAEVLSDGIRIVEQNSSAQGVRVLHGDPHGGYYSDWGTTPSCYVHADAAGPVATPPAPTDPPPGPAPGPSSVTKAQCDELGYTGECRGDTSVWTEGGWCHVRDCASEGKACGWIADGVGWGCLGGNADSTVFDCADVGYEGTCTADDTLVWAEGGACRVVHCPDLGLGCAWKDTIGYDCD